MLFILSPSSVFSFSSDSANLSSFPSLTLAFEDSTDSTNRFFPPTTLYVLVHSSVLELVSLVTFMTLCQEEVELEPFWCHSASSLCSS
eukprot:14020.XXX_706705_706968_1 [CDS] Oithona nana genome sequencing.